jgi:4-amino-4-deoxy-L-arabinose transferase-like glycosyltransferase
VKKIHLTKNPYLIFSPFLIVYIAMVLYFPTNGKFGDEPYYLMFAENLIQGFYSPPPPNIDLMYGPGLPIIIVPFIALDLPLISITLLNAVLYYFSIILLFKSLQQVAGYRIALIVSFFWAFYFDSYEQIHIIYTETITSFLITLVIFSITKAFNTENSQNSKRYIAIAGLAFGYIALTKVIFGYVLICMLIGTGLLYFIDRNSVKYRKGAIIMLIALATTSPYLIYTYQLTGRLFYWGSSGGNNLYWMSSPHHREYGDWYGFHSLESYNNQYEPSCIPGRADSIRSNHIEDFKELFKYQGVERDDFYKKLAINNIKENPGKFLQNCFSNVGRLLFNYPKSYVLQRPVNLLRLPLNGMIFLFWLFCSIPTIINWRRISYPIRFMIFPALLYFGGSVLGSAEPRMFSVIVPIILIWIGFIFEKSVIIRWKFDIG